MVTPRSKLTLAMARELILPERSDELRDLSDVEFTEAGVKLLLENIPLIAEKKQMVVSQREMDSEIAFGLANIKFLTKLHNLNIGAGAEGPAGLQARVACAKHLFTAMDQCSLVTIDDIRSYRADTVFGFADRDFDNLFEMGDGDKVYSAMIKLSQTSSAAASVCNDMGWDKAYQADRSRG